MVRRFTGSLVALVAALAVVYTLTAAQAPAAPEPTLSGTLLKGQPGETTYQAIVPEAWNGTLVLDLDFVTSWSPPQRRWFAGGRYAIGGIRRVNNEASYELRQYVDNLVEVRRLVSEHAGRAPARTIVFGVSRGAYVTLAALEARPDMFQGGIALSGGSLGLVGRMLSKFDRTWALKTLVDPDGPVRLINLSRPPQRGGNEPYAEDQSLAALIDKAKVTPAGRARLMLAAAFDQVPRWGTRGSPQPAANDYDAQLQQVVDNFAGGFTQTLRWAVEVAAGGNVSGNEGVDYAAMLQRSGLNDLVEHAYRKAGADLAADLDALRRAPRVRADAAALRRADEQLLNYSGSARVPVLLGTTAGDPAEPPSIVNAYRDLARSACERERRGGCDELTRGVYTARPGHATWSVAERIVLFNALIARLDEGRWTDKAEPEALRRSAVALRAMGNEDLGGEAFVALTPAAPLRLWDRRNLGSR